MILKYFTKIFRRGVSWEYRKKKIDQFFEIINLNKNPKDWKKLPLYPEEAKIFTELENPKYTFRTLGGLANSTNLDKRTVEYILFKYKNTYILSSYSEEKGVLFGLKSRVKPKSGIFFGYSGKISNYNT